VSHTLVSTLLGLTLAVELMAPALYLEPTRQEMPALRR